MDLSIILVNFNTKKITIECIKSVIKYTHEIKYQLVVVDNGSGDGTVAAIRKLIFQNSKLKIAIIENKENLGFARGNNQGIKVAEGKYILFLNSDTKLHEDVLSGLVNFMDLHSKRTAGIRVAFFLQCCFPNIESVVKYVLNAFFAFLFSETHLRAARQNAWRLLISLPLPST